MLLVLEWDLALDMQSMIFSYLSLGITITCTTFFDMDCKDFMLICYTATVLRSALLHHLCYGLHFSAAAECFEHVELWMKVMVFLTACVWYWGVVFCHSRIPKMGGKDLDLHVLYIEVTQRGGLHQVLPLRSLWPVQFYSYSCPMFFFLSYIIKVIKFYGYAGCSVCLVLVWRKVWGCYVMFVFNFEFTSQWTNWLNSLPTSIILMMF